jgi:ribosomal protein S18 acetylase RimI-like enzyme
MNLEIAISDLLYKLDNEFDPPLTSHLDIITYIKKIVANAKIVAIIEEGDLIAFIAFYCNDNINKIGYMSMLAVAKEKRGNGLAKNMINSAIENLKRKRFQKFRLEVYKTNINAIKLYQLNNFTIVEESDFSYIMELKINT